MNREELGVSCPKCGAHSPGADLFSFRCLLCGFSGNWFQATTEKKQAEQVDQQRDRKTQLIGWSVAAVVICLCALAKVLLPGADAFFKEVVPLLLLAGFAIISLIAVGNALTKSKDSRGIAGMVSLGLAAVSATTGLVLIVLVFARSFPWWPVLVAFALAGVFLVAGGCLIALAVTSCEKCGSSRTEVTQWHESNPLSGSPNVKLAYTARKCKVCGHVQRP